MSAPSAAGPVHSSAEGNAALLWMLSDTEEQMGLTHPLALPVLILVSICTQGVSIHYCAITARGKGLHFVNYFFELQDSCSFGRTRGMALK